MVRSIESVKFNRLAGNFQKLAFRGEASVAGNVAVQPQPLNNPEQKADVSKNIPGVEKTKDEILSSNAFSKFKIKVEQASLVPEYAVRGMKGDPDSNFFEFLKVAKIPYYLGGPVLACIYKAGGNRLEFKQKAVGVVLYYLAAALANMAVDVPVKLIRGIDLNHPYRDVVDLRAKTPDGISPKKIEYHKVFESIDFTRWDQLYRDDDAAMRDPKLVNERYNKIAKRMGVKKDINDSDSATKPYITKLLVMSRALKYFLLAPMVVLGLGISAQSDCQQYGVGAIKNIGNALGNIRKTVNKKKSVKLFTRARIVGSELYKAYLSPLVLSAGKFYKTPTGKASTFIALGSFILANVLIFRATTMKRKDAVDAAQLETNKSVTLSKS